MKAHSAAVCQWSSRTPPAVSLMFTPAMLLDTSSSRTVTSRDHPPECSLLCPKENGYLNGGTPPLSVGGGLSELGFWVSTDAFMASESLSLRSWSGFEDCECRTFVVDVTPATASAPGLTSKKARRENFTSSWS